MLRAEEGRVADDRIGLGPLGTQSIGDPDARQVDQRQDRLGLTEAVDHLPVPHPERHSGDEHRRSARCRLPCRLDSR